MIPYPQTISFHQLVEPLLVMGLHRPGRDPFGTLRKLVTRNVAWVNLKLL
jgi:hypothetical protein